MTNLETNNNSGYLSLFGVYKKQYMKKMYNLGGYVALMIIISPIWNILGFLG